MGEFDLTEFTVIDQNPDTQKEIRRWDVARQLNDSGLCRELLLQYFAHLGLYLTEEKDIIEDKLPETAAGQKP